MPGRSLTVLVAPDSFKGSLTSVEVARALAAGWTRARPDDRLVLAPLADGGEGTLVAIEAAGGWTWQEAAAHDPLGRPLIARWLRSTDGTRAVVELAAASGLSRLTDTELDPAGASTYGTGEVIRAALDAGVRRIDLGVGGSATTDGGQGILTALGLRATAAPEPVVDLRGLDPRLGLGLLPARGVKLLRERGGPQIVPFLRAVHLAPDELVDERRYLGGGDSGRLQGRRGTRRHGRRAVCLLAPLRAASGAAGVHPRGIHHFDRQAPSLAHAPDRPIPVATIPGQHC